MIKLVNHGSFKNAFAFLNYLKNKQYLVYIEQYAQKGVEALSLATPKDTGKTANSWRYEIKFGAVKSEIIWLNDNLTVDGEPIAIMLQYGHGTGTGGYVQGRDYINPAIAPVFDDILKGIEQAVKSA